MIPEKEIEALMNSFEHPEYNIPELMRQYGKQQWNEAIKLAAKNATILMKKKSQFGKSRKWQNVKENEEVDLFSYECFYCVNKKSILKLLKL